jgi:hypothetical protein
LFAFQNILEVLTDASLPEQNPCFIGGMGVSVLKTEREGYERGVRDQELKVFLTANLGTARHRAEEVAAECGLTSAITYKNR